MGKSALQAVEIDLALDLVRGPATLFDEFLRSQPFLSAFMMCGFKASAADFLAQTSESTDNEEGESTDVGGRYSRYPHQHDDSNINWMLLKDQSNYNQDQSRQQEQHDDDINLSRNVAFMLYGGLYQGMFLQLLYMVVYPTVYGDSLFRIPLCIATDVLLFGPFVTLPIAYIIRAVIDNVAEEETDGQHQVPLTTTEAMISGIDKYKNHIVTQELLLKYWMIWAPAQSFNNMFVPDHLRVFFVAFISFFWVFLLSIISNQEETDTTAGTTTTISTRPNEPARQTS